MKRPTSSKRRYRDFDAVDARDQPLQEQLPPLNGVNDETTALGLDQGDADQVPQQLLLSRVELTLTDIEGGLSNRTALCNVSFVLWYISLDCLTFEEGRLRS